MGMLNANCVSGTTCALIGRTTIADHTKRGRCMIPCTGNEAADCAKLSAVRTQTLDSNVVARWQHLLSVPNGYDPALDVAFDARPDMPLIEDEEDVFGHGGRLDSQ